jgi:Recombination endonuclease VII
MSPTKKCGGCGRQKPLDEFHVSNAAKGGKQGYCKECVQKRNAVSNWKRQGIDMTPELRSMIDEVNEGRCYICDRTPEEAGAKLKELGVDHDHKSMKTRGLLCHACNVAIGLFGEDPELMRIAADYVEFYYAAEVLDPHDPRPLDDAKSRPAVEEFLEWDKNRKKGDS